MGGAAEGPNAQAVVDANGNLKVPADYRTSYRFLGGWAIAAPLTRARGHGKCMSFTHRPARLRPIVKTGIFPTARCW